jgi:DNA-directed RNA polymerase specialized sigma24 family protein
VQRRRAEMVFRAALLEAVDAGHSYAELARTVGVSRQAVRQLVERARI